MHICKVL